MQITAALVCDPGRFRSNNQDNFLFGGDYLPAENRGIKGVYTDASDGRAPYIAAVFDGLGGYCEGEKAAEAAAEAFSAADFSPFASSTSEDWFNDLNDALVSAAKERRVGVSGTTAAAILILSGILHAVNVGDSRIYLCRDRELRLLSEDHTNWKLLEELELRNRQPELTQYLGMDSEFRIIPHAACLRLQDGDTLLICTDGLHSILDDDTLLQRMRKGRDGPQALSDLLREARDRGAKDNITAIMVTCTDTE